MKLNDKIREQRKAANLTQAQVAKELGIHVTTYSRFESGERKPDLYQVSALCRILSVPYDKLIDPDAPIFVTCRIPPDILDELERAMNEHGEPCKDNNENLKKYNRLRDALQPVIEERIKAMNPSDFVIGEAIGKAKLSLDGSAPVSRVILDARAENLIFECIELQDKLLLHSNND